MDFQIVVDALTKIVVDIINFIPRLINGLIILFVGILIARLASWLARVVLRRFDPLSERFGIAGALRGLGVTIPVSTIAAQSIFGLLLISFLITATRLMALEAVAQLLERLLLFLPNLIAALIVFVLGGIAAQFTGNMVRAMAVKAEMTYAPRLGSAIHYIISLFVAVIALGVLGIDTSLLVTSLTILIGAFGLAVGLAFGLGARGIVYQILAGYYIRQRFPPGQKIEINDISGEVSGIGGVNTVVATTDGAVTIPNSVLLDSIVKSSPKPANNE